MTACISTPFAKCDDAAVIRTLCKAEEAADDLSPDCALFLAFDAIESGHNQDLSNQGAGGGTPGGTPGGGTGSGE